MAYKKSTDTSKLSDVLARLRGETPEVEAPKKYSAVDKSRASTVLSRLLAQAASLEVTTITHPSHKVEEV